MLWQVISATTITVVALACTGCSKPSADDKCEAIVARSDLTDVEALTALAKESFTHLKSVVVEPMDGGDMAVVATVHPKKSAEVTTLEGLKMDSAQADKLGTLTLTTLNAGRMIAFGRQRKMARLTVRFQHTVLDDAGSERVADVFGFTLGKDAFDRFLATGTATNLIAGGAFATIEQTCTIDYDNFDKIEYQKKSP